jgi:hypothetical protein
VAGARDWPGEDDQAVSKAKVYWRPLQYEDQDPDDACWAVKLPGLDVGFNSWHDAYCWAYLTAALERLDV